MEGHIGPDIFSQFLAGACKTEQASYVETHIDACPECRQVLSNLVRSQRDQSNQRTDIVSPPQCPVAVGDTVNGKYRVEHVIGTGGMGSVVAAWHDQLNHRVALKFMLPQFASDAEAAGRFSREARSAARLRTPHVCRVLDLDKLANGIPFLVMEYLEGDTLEQRLEKEKKIEPLRAVDWARQAADALMEAHGVGIVHRDLKPANLFLTRWQGEEMVKVLDFGIAKSVDPQIEHGLKTTSQNMMIGSPPFMAPEQLNPGRKVDGRADVWSLGVVLYQLISGQLPFRNDNLVDLMFAIKNQPHRPLRELVPAVSVELAQVVDTCLTKAPEGRFQSAEHLSRALAALQVAPKPLGKFSAPSKPRSTRGWKSLPPRRVQMVVAAAALGAVLLGMTLWPGEVAHEVKVTPASQQVDIARPAPVLKPDSTPTAVTVVPAPSLKPSVLVVSPVPLPVKGPSVARQQPARASPRRAEPQPQPSPSDPVFGERR